MALKGMLTTTTSAQSPDAILSRPSRLRSGSPEQEAIWNEMLTGSDHLMGEALAGTGKTTTLLEGAYRMREQSGSARAGSAHVLYLAFNKSVQEEMNARAAGTFQALTYHAFGLQAVRQAYAGRQIRIDQNAMYRVLDGMRYWPNRQVLSGVFRLSQRAKEMGLTPDSTTQDFAQLADYLALDFGGRDVEAEVLENTPKALRECLLRWDAARTSRASSRGVGQLELDFADMLWLPWMLDLSLPQPDVLLADEVQDLNPLQHALTCRAAKSGRVMAIGDRKQSIYAFRGAVSEGMEHMRRALQESRPVVVLPLTFTRRCPKAVVELAQRLVPEFRAFADAPDGKVETCHPDRLLARPPQGVAPGDMVLCRTNAPLVKLAFRLIGSGRKAVIVGREIMQQIVDLIQNYQGDDLEGATREAVQKTERLLARLYMVPNGGAENRIALAQDRLECFLAAAAECSGVRELRAKLEELSDSRKPGVRLSTVHRAKGLEADRVWIMHPELMPHPMARKPYELEQEWNLLYVAVTRAKRELWIAGELHPRMQGTPGADRQGADRQGADRQGADRQEQAGASEPKQQQYMK